MENKIFVKKYSFRRKICHYYSIYGNVIFSNNKKVELYFIPSKHTVEIVYEKGDKILSKYERALLLELILREFCTFVKGIVHLSLGDNIENYTLTDIIGEQQQISKKTILYEFLDNNYSKYSKNSLFENLNKIYFQVNCQKEKIGKDIVSIALERKLDYLQKIDICYFIKYFLDKQEKSIKFNFPKEDKKVLKLIPIS